MSQFELNDTQWASLAAEFCKGFTKEQSDVCRTFCEIRGLLPGKHVVFQLRQASEWDESVHAKVKVSKIIFITTIDAARLIAQRTGQYKGQAPEQYIYLDDNGSPSIVSEIPLPILPVTPGRQALPREPWAVRTTVYRKDFDYPIVSTARFDAYAATYTNIGEVRLTEMWIKRGPEQLAKCSEMLSLRKSFPEELSNLYLDTELKSDPEEIKTTPASVTPVSVPQVPVVPKVNQVPAEPTSAPRPGEHEVRLGPNPTQDKEFEEQREKSIKEVVAEISKIGQTTGHSAGQESTQVSENKPVEPDIKPAKKGRKKKEPQIPENGQTAAPDAGITDEDFKAVGTPAPEKVDESSNATAFVESLDPTPTKEEQKVFSDRVRALAAHGAALPALKNYILNYAKKKDTKELTVGNWSSALGELDKAYQDGKLKEVTDAAPLPEF